MNKREFKIAYRQARLNLRAGDLAISQSFSALACAEAARRADRLETLMQHLRVLADNKRWLTEMLGERT